MAMFCLREVVRSVSIALSTLGTEKSLQVWGRRKTKEGSLKANKLNLSVQGRHIVQLLTPVVKPTFGAEITMVNAVRGHNSE